MSELGDQARDSRQKVTAATARGLSTQSAEASGRKVATTMRSLDLSHEMAVAQKTMPK